MTGRSIAAIGALALLVASCAETVPATGVVARIDADLGIGADARALSVVVRGGRNAEGLSVRHEQVLRGGELRWPIEVSIVPDGADDQRVFAIEATALDGS